MHASGNEPLPKLSAADLTLFQGKKQLEIVFFERQPATVGILVDTSGSMDQKLPICRSSIADFVNDLDPRDDAFLFAFSNRPFLLARLSSDHRELLQNLSKLFSYGRTAIYDSIADGLIMLSKGCYPRKALFVITDGMDNASRASLDSTIARASQARVPIYSIGIGNPNVHAGSFLGFTSNDMETVDTKALSQLANATGGETFVVTLNDSGQAFKHAAAAIADNINGQYIVGFVGDGSTNQLRLEAPSHKQIEFRILSHD